MVELKNDTIELRNDAIELRKVIINCLVISEIN